MKKRLVRVLIIIFVLLVSIVLFLFIYEYRSKQEQFFNSYLLSKNEIDSLQDGDIILRHGFGLVSDMIATKMNEKYSVSHCAIVCKPKIDSLYIIHSVSSTLSNFDGVQYCSFKNFVKESKPNSIIVVRYKSKKNHLISQKAKYYLDREVPFDDKFDIQDTNYIYCSELPWLIFFQEFNDDIFNVKSSNEINNKKFAAFWNPEKFDIIINHQEKK